MKAANIRSLLGTCFVVCSCAGQIQFAPDLGDESSVTADARTPVPLAPPPPDAAEDFVARLKSAVAHRDLAGIEALYQTNGVTSTDMTCELSRWQSRLANMTNSNVSVFFKDLGALPPTAHRVWSDYAGRLTSHKVTHLAASLEGPVVGLAIPLIEVDGRLWIVPSDKVPLNLCSKSGGAASPSHQLH